MRKITGGSQLCFGIILMILALVGLYINGVPKNIMYERNEAEDKLILKIIPYDYEYNEKEDATGVNFAIYWKWNEKPKDLFEDTIHIEWEEGLYGNATRNKRSTAIIGYVDKKNNRPYKLREQELKLTAFSEKIDIPMEDGIASWAQMGHVFIYTSRAGKVHEISGGVFYEHGVSGGEKIIYGEDRCSSSMED